MKQRVPAFLLALVTASVLIAQDEPAQTGAGAGGGRGGGGGAALGVPNPQPYDRVITKDAKSKKGMFTVHQVGERYYYEIPKKRTRQAVSVEYADRQDHGRRRLWRRRRSPNRVVRWELHNNRVYLRDINFSVTPTPTRRSPRR